jgi:para-aminobenzoate synthetase
VIVQTLLVDNYDSFTYNLFQLLAVVNGQEPVVLRNDDLDGWRRTDLGCVDNIVISPGPGRPERERDFGISGLALARTDLPLLGVCLGHQGLCQRYGALVRHAPLPMHGRLSPIHHRGEGLFAGIPTPFAAVRYHSLAVVDAPAALEVLATTDDGVLMAARHRLFPHWGVQFHPESIETEHGRRLLSNFRAMTEGAGEPRGPLTVRRPPPPTPAAGEACYEVLVEPVADLPDAERAYEALAGGSTVSMWLDSSSVVRGRSRFSVLCVPGPDLGQLVTYRVGAGVVEVTTLDGAPVERRRESVFDYLEREQRRRKVDDPGLPCEFALGYVGYLGYELKADCGGDAAHTAATPDAALAFCDRALVIDHETGGGWLLALATAATAPDARRWLTGSRQRLRALAARPGANEPEDLGLPPATELCAHTFRHPRSVYSQLIAKCLEAIADGESYEVCLTNTITTRHTGDPLLTYKILRRVNPAPYAALLRLGPVSVLSSSPERFLAIDRHGGVESKPIKGTRARSADAAQDAALAEELRCSEKDRAENLMIVDLVRNDLGSTAEVGSVHVTKLFAVESFASVHQLVSTIRARLRPGASPVRCVRASFPGGSMTGAPKVRTMEIIDALERGPRGVYSGALGYFSLNGAVDLSIVIRTVVLEGDRATIGTGGAIVALSDPEAEVEETMVKAQPVLRALSIAAAWREQAGVTASAAAAGRRGS